MRTTHPSEYSLRSLLARVAGTLPWRPLSAPGDTGRAAMGQVISIVQSPQGTRHGALERLEYRNLPPRPPGPRGAQPHAREPEKTNVAPLSPDAGAPARAARRR